MKTPSYEYELLHQFEVIFRDGEHKTQAATRDYSKVWENVIDNPPAEGVTPIHVYRMDGTTCAVIAGVDELVENEECAMEIARLAAAMLRERAVSERLADALKDASFAFALEVTANGNTTDGNMDRLERWNAALAAAKNE